MLIEHELDEGTLQASERAFQHVEARPRHPGAPFDVKPIDQFAQFPVGAGRKRHWAGLPDRLDHDVAGFVGAARHGVVDDVRNFVEAALEFLLDGPQARFQLLNLFADEPHLCDAQFPFRGVARCANCFAGGIAPGSERLDLLKEAAPLFVELQDPVDVDVGVAQQHVAANAFGVLSDELQTQHRAVLSQDAAAAMACSPSSRTSSATGTSVPPGDGSATAGRLSSSAVTQQWGPCGTGAAKSTAPRTRVK